MLVTSVADPFHFDTDPAPGYEKVRYGSGSRPNFDSDPSPGKNGTVRSKKSKKDSAQGKS